MTPNQNNNPQRALLTVGQAATLLNVHTNTVRRWERNGILPAYRIGTRGDRRFQRSRVESLLQAGSPR